MPLPRFDIHYQSLTPAEAVNTTKIMTFAYPQTIGVRGFQMCINLWLKILFTRQGSDPTNLDRGTAFSNLIGSNTTMSAAEDIVRTCVEQASEQLAGIQRKDQSLTSREILSSARMIRYQAKPTDPGFEAYIEIRNQAGERLLLNIPDYAKL